MRSQEDLTRAGDGEKGRKEKFLGRSGTIRAYSKERIRSEDGKDGHIAVSVVARTALRKREDAGVVVRIVCDQLLRVVIEHLPRKWVLLKADLRSRPLKQGAQAFMHHGPGVSRRRAEKCSLA